MQKKELGSTGLKVPAVMLGGNVFGWTVSENDSFRLLDAAFDSGLNFIDTADVYSRWIPGHVGGESETILGKWLARSGKRGHVILATKVGMDMGDGRVGLAPAYIEREVETSLKRLRTDYIDLYQAHKDDSRTRLEDTLAAFGRLIEKGKVRFIGASNYDGARLRKAMETSAENKLAQYRTLQPLYNLLEREDYEADLAPVVAEYALGVLPYFSLASGFLTGKYHSEADARDKPRGERVSKYLNARGFGVLAVLEDVAREYHSTPASAALAWLMAQPGITAPIASVTNEKQLADLVQATELKLDTAAIEKLSAASSPSVSSSNV